MSETTTGDRGKPASGSESASRVADVLLLFLEGSETLGVTEIARELGVHKTIVHRVLGSLASRQLVVKDERSRRYRLGPTAVVLGSRASRDLDLREVASPALRKLQRETAETAAVHGLLGSQRVCLDQVLSPQEVRVALVTGSLFPLHAGCSSLVILTFAPADVREHVLSGPLEALTPRTKVKRDEIERVLSEVRRTGVASSLGERSRGIRGVSSPILGVNSYAVGSLSVNGPVDRVDDESVERFSPVVREAAAEVSRKLGWDGNFPGETTETEGGIGGE